MEATFWHIFSSQWPVWQDAKVQAATFLHVAGPEALEVYNTFTWDDDDDKSKVNKIIKKFD